MEISHALYLIGFYGMPSVNKERLQYGNLTLFSKIFSNLKKGKKISEKEYNSILFYLNLELDRLRKGILEYSILKKTIIISVCCILLLGLVFTGVYIDNLLEQYNIVQILYRILVIITFWFIMLRKEKKLYYFFIMQKKVIIWNE